MQAPAPTLPLAERPPKRMLDEVTQRVFPTLRARFLASMLLLTLLPLLVGSAAVALTARTIFAQRAQDLLEGSANARADQVTNWIEERQRDMALLAQVPTLKTELPIATAASRNVNGAEFQESYFRLRRFLEDARVNLPVYNNILLLDRENRVIVSTTERNIDQAQTVYRRDWLRGDMETFHIGPAERNVVDGVPQPILIVRHPIFSTGGTLQGQIIAEASLAELQQNIAARAGLGETGDSYLLNDDLRPLTPLRFLPPTAIGLREIKTMGAVEAQRRARYSGSYRDYRGQEVLGISLAIPQTEWILMTEVEIQEVQAPLRNAALPFLGFLSLVSAVVIGTGIYAATSLSRPIREIATEANRVASGNLLMPPARQDVQELVQLNESFRTMVSALREAMGAMQHATNDLNGLSTSLIGTSNQQAAGANEQAAGATELSATLEELNHTATQIATNSVQLVSFAGHTADSAQRGQQHVADVVSEVQALGEHLDETREALQALSDRTRAAARITTQVQTLADQTHLLALNAAIEAAGAGAYGQRFGVVAAEVQELADRAAAAAKQIGVSLAEIDRALNTSMSSGAAAAERSAKGLRRAARAAGELAALRSAATTAAEAADHISAATGHQRLATQQSVQTMREIAGVARDTASLATSLSARANNLREISGRLETIISRFQLPDETL